MCDGVDYGKCISPRCRNTVRCTKSRPLCTYCFSQLEMLYLLDHHQIREMDDS